VVRLFNTVGPGQIGDYGMVLPRFVRAALEGRAIEVYGDGTQTRCFCDVRDVVQAFPALLDQPAALGRVFNVGSDQPISIYDLATTVVRTLASASSVRLVPYAEAYAPGFEDLRDRRPDLSRIRTLIGWQSRLPLDRTIRDVAASLGATREPQRVAGGSR
jgi:UDP-glucose 4-epimerase